MENRENMYYKMPFYMTYPIQNMYLTEMEYERDMERMKELYPREVKQLQDMVEQRCDELEYEGSRMYDENPDRMMLEEETRRLLERFLRENPQYGMMQPPIMPMPRTEDMRPPVPRGGDMRMSIPRGEDMRMQVPRAEDMRMPTPRTEDMPMPRREDELSAQQHGGYREPNWLRSLIGILFHDEMYRRRCRHRRCSRWW